MRHDRLTIRRSAILVAIGILTGWGLFGHTATPTRTEQQRFSRACVVTTYRACTPGGARP